jgi:hypothetical protein
MNFTILIIQPRILPLRIRNATLLLKNGLRETQHIEQNSRALKIRETDRRMRSLRTNLGLYTPVDTAMIKLPREIRSLPSTLGQLILTVGSRLIVSVHSQQIEAFIWCNIFVPTLFQFCSSFVSWFQFTSCSHSSRHVPKDPPRSTKWSKPVALCHVALIASSSRYCMSHIVWWA